MLHCIYMLNLNLAHYLDFANHNPDATRADIAFLVSKVQEFGFNSAFVNQYYLPEVKKLSEDSIKVGTIISFPLGQDFLDTKIFAVENCTKAGASELDISLNVSLLKQAHWDQSLDEMLRMVDAARNIHSDIIIKFIPETGYLTPTEIQKTAELILSSGADFFKTCSGMGPRGASLEDVKLVKNAIGDSLRIKVAGGVSTTEQVEAFIEAGASRVGTSHALDIIGATSSDPESENPHSNE